MTVDETKLKTLLKGVDCCDCPLRRELFRCSVNVGVVAPIKCETLLIKWLQGEKLNPYWEDEDFQEALRNIK